METLAAIALVIKAINTFMEVEPILASGFKNIEGYGIALFQKYTGKPITPEQRTILQQHIKEMHERFQRPVPPADQQ